jgi:hypothetical protein
MACDHPALGTSVSWAAFGHCACDRHRCDSSRLGSNLFWSAVGTSAPQPLGVLIAYLATAVMLALSYALGV